MYKNKKYLAVIPARSGSKRLPKKNILDLAGKPLIAWTIDAARKSKYLDTVMVTTDDQALADLAVMYGADVPFIRPESLASDDASTIDVVEHVVNYYNNKLNSRFDFIVLLQPTSPFREAEHIDGAIELLMQKNADAVISVCEAEHSPLWVNVIPENGDMSGFLTDSVKNKRSQELPSYYRLNGAIYICDCDRFFEEKNLFLSSNIYAYEMPAEVSVDIDNQIDLDFASFMLSKHQLKK